MDEAMPTQVILENDDAILWYHSETKIIHHYLKRYVYGKALHIVLEIGAKALEANRATKWLSDDRNNSALSPDDEVWGNEVWFPRALRAGWKHWAIVQPEKVVGQLNMRRFKESYSKSGLNAQMFSDPEQAKKWLIEQ
jgi:hypothetical protein